MKKENVLFDTFVGEYVEIVLGLEVTNSISLSEEGHAHEMKMPLTLVGFFMDIDGEFIYLSSDGETVNQAFPKSELKHIQIVPVTDPIDEILDDVLPPDDRSGYN